MTHSWPEVNAAVMAVLAEIGRRDRPTTNVSKNGHVFHDRLLSLRHAESIESGPIQVVAGTVITPMARDLLKRRGIAISLVSRGQASARRGEWAFAIESKSGILEAFRRAMLEGGAWAEVGRGVADLTDWIIQADGRGALLVVDEASIATYRASRIDGVRAATVAEPEAVSRAVRALGANLIVVEPMGKSIHQLKQIGERFRLAGAPEAIQ